MSGNDYSAIAPGTGLTASRYRRRHRPRKCATTTGRVEMARPFTRTFCYPATGSCSYFAPEVRNLASKCPCSTSGFAPLLPIRERGELMPLFVRRRLTRSLGGEEMRGGTRKNAGRKPVEIDVEDWEKLHAMHCSVEEIAG